jgi:ABC-2 type transport system ATP-binding protein
MVVLDGVSKSYGRTLAVDGVSLSLTPGAVTGLLGPNGAGKSTIIRMIACLLAPSKGRVSVSGHDTLRESDRARLTLGYLPEFAPLYHEMTPDSYLRYRARLFPLPAGARAHAVDQAVARCHLGELRHRRIGALSKGYRQRVGLAAAILHDPKVIVLDEPTTGLDPAQIRESRELFRALAHDRVVLLSSHILPEIEATCDRVVIMARGRVRADGTPAQLLSAETGARPYVVQTASPADTDSLAARIQAHVGARLGATAPARIEHAPDGTLHVFAPPATGAHTDHDVLALIGRCAHGDGTAGPIALRQLHRPAPTLEQVFLRVITQEAPAP